MHIFINAMDLGQKEIVQLLEAGGAQVVLDQRYFPPKGWTFTHVYVVNGQLAAQITAKLGWGEMNNIGRVRLLLARDLTAPQVLTKLQETFP